MIRKKAIKSFFKQSQFYGTNLECDVASRLLELGCMYSLRIFHDNVIIFIHNVFRPNALIYSEQLSAKTVFIVN